MPPKSHAVLAALIHPLAVADKDSTTGVPASIPAEVLAPPMRREAMGVVTIIIVATPVATITIAAVADGYEPATGIDTDRERRSVPFPSMGVG